MPEDICGNSTADTCTAFEVLYVISSLASLLMALSAVMTIINITVIRLVHGTEVGPFVLHAPNELVSPCTLFVRGWVFFIGWVFSYTKTR